MTVKEMRTKKCMSQEEFAEFLGVHRRTVLMWEKLGQEPKKPYTLARKWKKLVEKMKGE